MNHSNKMLIIIYLLSANLGHAEKVIEITDGDTFVLLNGEKVRMIGINAPEESDIYGIEATNYLSRLILNKEVLLQSDKIGKDRDRYGRLLRYVVLDSVDINRKMISDGYAFAYLKYKFSKKNEYRNAQLSSQKLGFGIWGNTQKTQESEKEVVSDKKYSISNNLIMLMIGIVVLIGVGIKVMLSE